MKLRGTQWICSSKYVFFRPIFAGWKILKKKICSGTESFAGMKIIVGVGGQLMSRIGDIDFCQKLPPPPPPPTLH